jgi:hypothetical protein
MSVSTLAPFDMPHGPTHPTRPGHLCSHGGRVAADGSRR